MPNDTPNMKNKWNKRAKDYPRYTEDASTIEDRVLALVKDAGVSFAGKTVLDVGCGTGRFTIRIAKMAKEVTGTDIAEDMLKAMIEDAGNEGIANIEAVCADWKDFSDKRKWDIAVATFTPAVGNLEDFKRFIEMAEEYVIYLGWALRKNSEMVQKIYGMYGKEQATPAHSKLMDKLDSFGYPYQTFDVSDMWKRTLTIENAVENFYDDLTDQGAEPDRDAIRKVIAGYSEDGREVTYSSGGDFKLAVISKKP